MSSYTVKCFWWRYVPGFLKSWIKSIIENRTKKLFHTFETFIESEKKVLDIGIGGGWIGQMVREKKNAKVTLLDVVDLNQTSEPLVLYDGKTIPFSRDFFDTSLLLLVLHHCEDPINVLQEAKRVTSRKIIIFEDTFVSRFDKILVCLGDIIWGLPSFFVNPSGEHMPCNFKRVAEWKKIFKSLDLKIIYQKEYRTFFTKQVLFVVQI